MKRTSKISKRTKHQQFGLENSLIVRRVSAIQGGVKEIRGALRTDSHFLAEHDTNKSIVIKKTLITVGEATAMIGTIEYIKKISNLPAYQKNEQLRKAKLRKRVAYLPKVHFSGEQFKEAMHLVSTNLLSETDKK